jgi:hypothetical protein
LTQYADGLFVTRGVLRAIVHEKANVDQAEEIFLTEKNKS